MVIYVSKTYGDNTYISVCFHQVHRRCLILLYAKMFITDRNEKTNKKNNPQKNRELSFTKFHPPFWYSLPSLKLNMAPEKNTPLEVWRFRTWKPSIFGVLSLAVSFREGTPLNLSWIILTKPSHRSKRTVTLGLEVTSKERVKEASKTSRGWWWKEGKYTGRVVAKVVWWCVVHVFFQVFFDSFEGFGFT